jgi:hypothetical protein
MYWMFHSSIDSVMALWKENHNVKAHSLHMIGCMWWCTPVFLATPEAKKKARSSLQDSPGKKLVRSYLKNKIGLLWHTYNSSYMGGRNRRILSEASPAKNLRPYLKNKLKPKGLGAWFKWLKSTFYQYVSALLMLILVIWLRWCLLASSM